MFAATPTITWAFARTVSVTWRDAKTRAEGGFLPAYWRNRIITGFLVPEWERQPDDSP